MRRTGLRLSTIFYAVALGGVVLGGCAGNRAEQSGDGAGGNPTGYGGNGAVDPYDSVEIPPEALEFPEPPGVDLGPDADPLPDTAPSSGQASDQASGPAPDSQPRTAVKPGPKAPGSDLMIPDVSGKIPLLPPLLEPRGRDGFVEVEDRNDVVDKFDMPTRMKSVRFVYSRHRSFPDFKQVVFAFDLEGKLLRVDLFPSRAITRQEVIERYGGGFYRKSSGGYEILNYRRLQLVFFLQAASDTVYSIRLKK